MTETAKGPKFLAKLMPLGIVLFRALRTIYQEVVRELRFRFLRFALSVLVATNILTVVALLPLLTLKIRLSAVRLPVSTGLLFLVLFVATATLGCMFLAWRSLMRQPLLRHPLAFITFFFIVETLPDAIATGFYSEPLPTRETTLLRALVASVVAMSFHIGLPIQKVQSNFRGLE